MTTLLEDPVKPHLAQDCLLHGEHHQYQRECGRHYLEAYIAHTRRGVPVEWAKELIQLAYEQKALEQTWSPSVT